MEDTDNKPQLGSITLQKRTPPKWIYLFTLIYSINRGIVQRVHSIHTCGLRKTRWNTDEIQIPLRRMEMRNVQDGIDTNIKILCGQ